jgi:hypothetical protein
MWNSFEAVEGQVQFTAYRLPSHHETITSAAHIDHWRLPRRADFVAARLALSSASAKKTIQDASGVVRMVRALPRRRIA